MSKYSHFEMCKKIFGQKYKWNEQKHDYEPYSRTDMWNKMIEQQDKIADLEAKLAESEKKAYSRGHSQRDIANEIKLNALREDVANKEKRIVELKQSQKHLAIEQLEKVEEILWNSQDIGNVIDNDKFLEKLNYLIKSLKGEK